MIDIGIAHDSRTHSILQEYAPFHPGTIALRSDSVFRGPNNENTDTHLLSDKDRDGSGGSEGKKQSHEVSMELPTGIQEGIGAVDNGDHLGKEKQPCVQEAEVLSQIKIEDADDAMECCPTQDSVSKDLYPKGEISSSNLEADLSDQQSAMVSESLDSVEKGSSLDEKHRPQQDICCTDEQNQWLQHDVPDKGNEPEGKEDASEQSECVVDEPHNEKAALIVSDETIGSLDRSIPPTNGEETQESRAEVSLICSLGCDQKGEGSEMIDSQIPEEGVHEDATHPHDARSDGVADEAEGQKETPSIDGTAASRPTDVQEESCVPRGQPELSEDRTPQSPHDDRCPTPTLDEEPYQYTPSSGPSGEGTDPTAIPVDETPKPMSQKGPSQISASSKRKIPLRRKQKAAVKTRPNITSAPTAVNCKEKLFSEQNHKAKDKHDTERGKLQATSAEKSPAQSAHLPKEPLQTFKTNTKKDEPQKPQQASVEPPSCSHSLIIATKMPKSVETQGQITSEDLKIENSKVEPSKTSTDLKTSRLLEERTTFFKDQRERRQEEEGTSEPRPQSSSNVNKSNVERPTHQPAATFHQLKRGDSPELKRVIEIVGKESPERGGTDQEHTDDVGDDFLRQGPRGSLRCTIFNTSQKRSSSFLEQMSRRCLQEDLTEALVETECLIFSEQMKQVLKKSKDDSIRNRAPDPFPSSPAAACSGSLPDKGVAEAGPGSSSFVGLKITVDLSDRKPKADTTEEETSGSSQRDGRSRVTAGRTRPYAGKTDEVRKGPVRHKDARPESGEWKTDASDHVKRESSHKNMHLVVKRSGKAKSRFYILVTSDDPLFEKTKVRARRLTPSDTSLLQPQSHVESSQMLFLDLFITNKCMFPRFFPSNPGENKPQILNYWLIL